jgi:hypothetical protein
MRSITTTVGPLTAQSANNIALSQTPGAAGALTLNGALVANGVAVIGTSPSAAQRITITTTDSTHTFTITGSGPMGGTLTETVTGNGTSATSVLDYLTITSIVISGAATGAVTVGTSGVGASPWVRFDDYAPGGVSIQCDISGTVNYTIQQTLDDPNDLVNPVVPSAITWLPTSDSAGVGAVAAIQSNYQFAPVFARVLLNSGSGSVTAKFLQSGVVPY